MQWWGGHPGQGALQPPPFLVPPANFYLNLSSPTFLEHLEQVLCEMISFLCLIYALKTWCKFDVLGGGPLTLLLASGKVRREEVEAEVESSSSSKPEREKSREICDKGESGGKEVRRSPSSERRGAERRRRTRSGNASSCSEEEEDAARSALVSSWSGDEDNVSSTGEISQEEELGGGTKEEEKVEKEEEEEECDPNIDEEASSSDSSDSNITSELSDDQTFDDSVCDDEMSNGGGVEGEEVTTVNDIGPILSDYITSTPWYSEWAPKLVLRYYSVLEPLIYSI